MQRSGWWLIPIETRALLALKATEDGECAYLYIKDRTWTVVGVGAVVMGHVRIGDNVQIGPHCVVTSDVPADRVLFVAAPRVLPKIRRRDCCPTVSTCIFIVHSVGE